jgi:hypothetical protein
LGLGFFFGLGWGRTVDFGGVVPVVVVAGLVEVLLPVVGVVGVVGVVVDGIVLVAASPTPAPSRSAQATAATIRASNAALW